MYRNGFSPFQGEGWWRASRRGLAAVAAVLVAAGLWACGSGDDPPAAVVEASATIGTEGGTLEGPDGVVVKVPAGALTEATTIRIARTAEGSPSAPPDGYAVNGNVYEITPHDLVFLYPVTIEMPWAPVAGAGDQRPFTASPLDVWLPIDPQVAGGKASWMANSFSWFMIGVCAPQANDPYSCVDTRLKPTVTSSVPDALHLRLNDVDEIAWTVDKPTTLSISLAYSAAADCVDGRIKVSRRASATRPAETLIDTGVGLVPDLANDKRRSGNFVWNLPIAEDGNGIGAYDVRFSCQRPNRNYRTSAGGMLMFFAEIAPQPPQAPAFVTQPVNTTVNVGSVASFNVAASGNPAPTLQWQSSTDAGATWSNIAGETGASYTTPATVAGDNGTQFRVLATNASATVASNAAILTVKVPDAVVWSAPVQLASAWGSAFAVELGFAGAGDAVAVWSGAPTGGARAYASARPKGGDWSTPLIIDGGFGNAYETRLAATSSGSAMAVWQYQVGSEYRLAANRLGAGAWGAAERIDAGGGNVQEHRVAIDDAGRAIVAWEQYDSSTGSLRNLIRVRFNGGGAWSVPTEVAVGSQPAVAVDKDGKGYVAWLSGNQTWVAPVDLGAGTVGTATALQPAPAADPPGNLRFAMDRSGHGLLAWNEYNILRTARLDPTAGWLTVETAATDVAIALYREHSIAIDGSGQAIVAWANSGQRDIVKSVRYQPTSTTTGAWSAPFQHSTVGAEYAIVPRVAMNAAGRAALVWIESPENTYDEVLKAQVYDAGWGAVQELQGPVQYLSDQWANAVAIAADGDLVAIWATTTSGDSLFSASSP